MYRLLAFIAVIVVIRQFVDGPIRSAFSGTVKSSSMLVPLLNIAAPDVIYFGVAGLLLPVVMIGSQVRFKRALLIGALLVILVQTMTMFVFGAVIALDWRGYVAALAPLLGAVVAFVLAAWVSFMMTTSLRPKMSA